MIIIGVIIALLAQVLGDWFFGGNDGKYQIHYGPGDNIVGDKYEFNGGNEVPTTINIEEEYKNRKISNGYESRYWVNIVPSRSLLTLRFIVKTKELILTRLDVLPSVGMAFALGGNESDRGETNFRWKEYQNPSGKYRVTIYSNKISTYKLSFIPSPNEEIEIVGNTSF